MSIDSIKGKMKDGIGSSFLKVVNANESAIRGAEYVKRNPKKAAQKAIVGTGNAAIVKPLKGLALIGTNFAKEATMRTAPWAGKKIFAGAKATLKGAATTARRIDDRTINMAKDSRASNAVNALVQRSDEGLPAVHAGTLETLRDGLTASMAMHKLIVANEASLKLGKKGLAVHVASTLAIKGSKILGATVLMHIPGMQHIPFLHFLNEQATISKYLHLNSLGEEGLIAAGLGVAGDHKFATSLDESNVEAIDREMWARSGGQVKNMRAMKAMVDAMESLEFMVHAQAGTVGKDGKPIHIQHNDIERVRAGLEAAREMTAYTITEDFSKRVGELDFSGVYEMADKKMAEFHLSASGNGPREVPEEIIPAAQQDKGKGKEVVGERTRGLFSRLRAKNSEARVAKKEDRAKRKELRSLKKTEHAEEKRAHKYDEKMHKAQNMLRHMEVDNEERERQGKPVQYNDGLTAERLDAKIRLDLAHAKQALAHFTHGAIEEGKQPDEGVVMDLQTIIANLESKVAAQRAVMEKIEPLADRVSWSGMKRAYGARITRFTTEKNEHEANLAQLNDKLAEFDLPSKQDKDQKWRLAKKTLQERITKVESKVEIARLQIQLAEKDLELGGIMKADERSSDEVIENALANRLDYLNVETKLYAAEVKYDNDAGAQHRSSVWVDQNAKFSETGGKGVNSLAKFGWWSMALFPVTALPYWGIRHATTSARDARYLSYMKATLGEDA